jgi:aminoacylase
MNFINNTDKEIVEFFQKYIRIKTAQPDPNYRDAIALFINQAQEDGFPFEVITLESGYPALVISLPGANETLPSLILNHHMDVVPASVEGWVAHPFEGHIIDEKIVGRGTQDTKGIGVAHYFALHAIKKSGIKLSRSVHILLMPDEERGGFGGTGCFVKTEQFKKLNVGYVLDEGIPSGSFEFLYISFGERKPVQISIDVKGDAAHASLLMASNPAHLLIKLLSSFHQLHEESYNRAIKQDDDPGNHISFHITSLDAGFFDTNRVPVLNMIPACASATIDIRVPPHISIHDIYQRLNQMVKTHPNVSYRVLAAADDALPMILSRDLEKALHQVLFDHDITAKMKFFEGASDMRFYRNRGIEAIGFAPVFDKPLLHAVNESLSITSLLKGCEIFISLLKIFCI